MDDVFSPSPESPALIIGAAGIDIVGSLRGELNRGTSNPSQIRTSFGGVARNVAENLARLGHPVVLITAVGEDEVGDRLIQQVCGAGVEVSAVLRTSNFPTDTYLAVVNSRGELQFALDDMRAISALTPAYLQERFDLFQEASLLFLDANLSKETLRKAFSLAKRANIPICANPTSAALAHRLRPYLPRLRMITPNTTEAGVLCDWSIETSNRRQALDAAKCLVSQGVDIAIVTLTEFGVCYATSETSGQVPAIHTKLVDPTGGGDALTAAVIFALLNDFPLDDAIRLGASAAALTLRFSGAVAPDLSLERLYDQLVI